MTNASKNTITLKGSTDTVTEFFQYAMSSILYQRGVYPPENFEPQKKFGITVMAVKDPKLATYLQTVLQQFSRALLVQHQDNSLFAQHLLSNLEHRHSHISQSGWAPQRCRRWFWSSRGRHPRRCWSAGRLTSRRTRQWWGARSELLMMALTWNVGTIF